MIILEKEQYLGYKALLLFFWRRTAGVIMLVFFVFILSLFKEAIVANIATNLTNDYTISAESISNFISRIESGLFIVALVLFALGILIGWLEYIFFTFTLEEFNLKVKRGILNREELTIPYRQIQNVDIDRSIFYQIIGVSKLTIVNASHDDNEGGQGDDHHDERNIVLDPLENKVAEDIREELSHRIGIQVVRDDSDESLRTPKVNSHMD